jgi:16S rRNA (cytidine1402-2'-O)-methyltransferase
MSEPSSPTYMIEGHRLTASQPASALWLVATPIGNLKDITLRALEVIAGCDVLYCEDTRVTRALLDRYGISKPLETYHEHNATKIRPKIIEALESGKSVALVSDAGTPLISDPGFDLVRAATEAGHQIYALPGASAALAGLCVSGLPSDRFLFAGFLPHKQEARRKKLAELAGIPSTLILYEGPSRIAKCLQDMSDVLGMKRQAVVARELTKRYETIYRGSLEELAEAFSAMPSPKGEIVILIGPPEEKELDEQTLDALLSDAVQRLGPSKGAAEVAKETGLAKRDLYSRALGLKSSP